MYFLSFLLFPEGVKQQLNRNENLRAFIPNIIFSVLWHKITKEIA